MEERCSALASQWSQYCALKIHADLSDCSACLIACFKAGARIKEQEVAERAWSANGDALALLSVRSGMDLLCSCIAWPKGSEVIVTALNIPDVPRILRYHGLKCIPVDIDIDTLAPAPGQIESAITSQTVAILVAHVYGARVDMKPINALAKERGIFVIEDCAEAYCGSSYKGCDDSDVSLFSFGPIKYATAFQGAVMRCKHQGLLQRMRRAHGQWPRQSRWTYFLRALRFTLYVLLQKPQLIGVIMWVLGLLGVDHQWLFVLLVRSFWGGSGNIDDYLRRLRIQPSAPLLTALTRRFVEKGQESAGNQEAGRMMLQLLGENGGDGRERGRGGCRVPGHKAQHHTFWLFPILAAGRAKQLAAALRREGVDASTGSSQIGVVRGEGGGTGDGECPQAVEMMRDVVYVPVTHDMPARRVEETARLILKLSCGQQGT